MFMKAETEAEKTAKTKTVTAKKKTSEKTAQEKPSSAVKKKNSESSKTPKPAAVPTKKTTTPPPAPKSKSKKKKKLKLKKSVKITLLSICAGCVIIGAVAGQFSKLTAAKESDTIKLELPPPDAPPVTEATTEPTTEEETLPDPNMPFIDYDMEIDPNKPMIALTYDDGPEVGSSSKILDVLEEYHAHATFFVVGDNINEETEDIIRREVELGCEVGNHTQSHISLTSLDVDTAEQTLKNCDEKVFQCTNRYPQHVRPPYGAYNDEIREADRRMFIYWSLDTSDWKLRDADKVYNVVMEYIGDGDIVLMHDIHAETAEASERLIPDLIDMGYQLVTVSELMHYRHLDEEECMVLFNVHPDEPFFDSMFGTVYQKPTETTEETETDIPDETQAEEISEETDTQEVPAV